MLMSRNIQSFLFGAGAGIAAWFIAPYLSSSVDQVWWVGQIPGTTDIVGREFVASSLGLGAWLASLVNSVSALERDGDDAGVGDSAPVQPGEVVPIICDYYPAIGDGVGELGLVRSSTAIATSNDAGWTASRRADAL